MSDTPSRPRLGKVRGHRLPQEYDLARFFRGIEEPPKTWSTETPACRWRGVRCNSQSKINRIDISCTRSKGTIDWAHSPETAITINLPQNTLSGSVQWESLPPYLEELRLHNNAFEGEIHLGDIPRSMQKIRLDYNKFSGEVDFSNVPRGLVELVLSHNRGLTGSVDVTKLSMALRADLSRSQNLCWKGTQIVEKSFLDMYVSKNSFLGTHL